MQEAPPGPSARQALLRRLGEQPVTALVCLLYAAILAATLLSPGGAVPRGDFVAFYDAARMAIAGDAAGAYDWSRLRILQSETLGIAPEALVGFLGWVNPPPFFFMVMPFAGLPFAAAWLAWVVATAAALGFALRLAVPGMALRATLFVLAMPAVLICAMLGQNGLLTAALLCVALGVLDRRPVVAGVALGLLTYKPQFGLLLPLLLAATGRWRTFGVAAACAALLAAASAVAFGTDAWAGFLGALSRNEEMYLAVRDASSARMQSVYVSVFHATGDRALAWAVHGAFAGCVAASVLWLWLRRPEGPPETRAAAALAAAFLMTPFAWIYDAPALGVAAVFLAAAARREGWLAGEGALLLLACLLPGLLLLGVHLPMVAPVAWLLILACAWRRDRASRFSPARRGSMSAGT